jgi:pimeloyl-ACP methyl ester carboxylesterase
LSVTSIQIQGIDVEIAGSEGPCIMMVHGWPDTAALWDGQVEALKGTYRCVRFTWPGFDTALGEQARSLEQLCGLLRDIIDTVSPNEPVILLMHDWGCVFGQAYLAQHASRVCAPVILDIGDFNHPAYIKSLSLQAKLGAMSYQLWLACAWQLGSRLRLKTIGNWMARSMAKLLRAPGARVRIGYSMCYPYAMAWFGSFGGFKSAPRINGPLVPTLYVYATKKPFQFHSPRWLQALQQRDDCQVLAMSTGHWMMHTRTEELNQAIIRFFMNTDSAH